MQGLLLALCVPLFAACGPLGRPQPNEITKIVLSRTDCHYGCRFVQYGFYSSGRFTFTDGVTANALEAKLPPGIFSTITTIVVQTPMFGRRWDYLDDSTMPSTYLWVEAGDRHWQVRFPTYIGVTSFPNENENVYKFTRTAEFLSHDGEEMVDAARAPIIARLRDLKKLESVTFDSLGCYGRCPRFHAVFNSDGTATLGSPMFVAVVQAPSRAHVPFAAVIAGLRRSGVASMLPEYPIHAIDTYGVRFTLRFADGFTYTIYAPDSTSWPSPVERLVAAFSQLVSDTEWQAEK